MRLLPYGPFLVLYCDADPSRKAFKYEKKYGYNVAPLRLPPPHLRVSYFYPTTFGVEGPPAPLYPPPNPPGVPPWFPPLTPVNSGPAYNYLDDLEKAFTYPFLTNQNDPEVFGATPGQQNYNNRSPNSVGDRAPEAYNRPSISLPPSAGSRNLEANVNVAQDNERLR